MVKLIERYGEKDYRLNKFSVNDNEMAQLVYAAGMIFSGSWSFPDGQVNHPAMTQFTTFTAILRDPNLEVLRARPVGELQPVLLEAKEIAHMIWESDRRGIICPNYKNPEHAKKGDVYLSAHSIRGHIRSGTIPSLVSFIDEAAQRKQKEQASLELAKQQAAALEAAKQQAATTVPVKGEEAATTTTTTTVPVKGEEAAATTAPPVPPAAAVVTVNAEKTGVPGDKKATTTDDTKSAPKAAASKGNAFDNLEPIAEVKPKKHRKKQRKEEEYGAKDKQVDDPYGSIEFLSKK
jgi:type II secretory pathway pseudopilin PulG